MQIQAIVNKGIIGGHSAVIWFDLTEMEPETIFAIARYEDGQQKTFSFEAVPPEGNKNRKVWFPIDQDKLIMHVSLYWMKDKNIFEFDYNKDEFFLGRLLSRCQEEVDSNIRWSGRIVDFETRLFSAHQSYRYLKSTNLSLALHCLVSVAYTCIEHNRATDCSAILNILLSSIQDEEQQIEGRVKSSVLCAIFHLAVHLRESKALALCGDMHMAFCHEDSYIGAGYNPAILTLFCGYHAFRCGDLTRAADIFRCSVIIFEALAKDRPIHLNDFRERVVVVSWLYMCRVGMLMADGKSVEVAPDLPSPMLTSESLIIKNSNDGQRVACRLWGDKARNEFLNAFEEVIKS